MTTLEAIVMKEHDKDKNILTILKYFSIDWIKKTCWKEIVNLAGYEVTTYRAVEASDNSISGMLLATGLYSAVIKVIWHYFHCLKLQE
jgi:hypothetical protein